MMPIEKVQNVHEIFSLIKGNFSVEYKYDGIRVQIHKKSEKIKIFSRNLNDITENLPSIILKIKDNLKNIDEFILEGELIGFKENGEILPFQVLMSDIFNKEKESSFNLDIFLFDILYLNGKDLTNLPYFERMKILEDVKNGFKRVKFLIPKNVEEVKNFYNKAIKEGFEGIMVKDLNGNYKSGKRGKLWLKLKKVLTLDLVILEAFWGYGRRMNWLSDYMLYCLSKDGKRFLPLGKTFKGLTDLEFEEMTKRLLSLKVEDLGYGVRVNLRLLLKLDLRIYRKVENMRVGMH